MLSVVVKAHCFMKYTVQMFAVVFVAVAAVVNQHGGSYLTSIILWH